MSELRVSPRRGRQGRKRAMMAQDLLRSFLADSPREQRSQRSQPRQGSRSIKEHKRSSGLDLARRRAPRRVSAIEQELRAVPRAAPGRLGRLLGQLRYRHRGAQVTQLEAMKKTAQELGDQELLANIETKLHHAQKVKAESRPWSAQMDIAQANLEKAIIQIDRAQETGGTRPRRAPCGNGSQSRSRKTRTESPRAVGPGPRNDPAGTVRSDGAHPADRPSEGTNENGIGTTGSWTPPCPAPARPTRTCCQPFESSLSFTKHSFLRALHYRAVGNKAWTSRCRRQKSTS